MSRFIPTKYNKKQLQLQWINDMVHGHDLLCGCEGPLEHIILEITNQEKNLRFTDKEKQQLKKCLFGDDTTTADEEIGDADLAALFGDEYGDQNTEDVAG